MHSLTIVFGPTGTQFVLLYTAKNNAEDVFKKLLAPASTAVSTVVIADDFGQSLAVRTETIYGIMLEDLNLSGEAAIERGLHAARVNAKGQTRAQSDPVLKFAAMGPQIVGPRG